jgi:hypothetical protein
MFMSQENHLTKAVDMLFTLALFYILIQWPQLATWQSKVLWIGVFLIALNEQVSVRATYDVYGTIIYLLDLGSLFIYVVALQALVVVDTKFGYNPEFWAAISVLWLFYAIWDYVMMPYADKEAKKNLRKWAFNMMSAFLVTFVSYLVISYGHYYLQGETLLLAEIVSQALAFGIILWALYLWNKDRIARAVEVINEAKGTKRNW